MHEASTRRRADKQLLDLAEVSPDKVNVKTSGITQEDIAATNDLIRPQIRRTPVIEIRGGDFDLEVSSLTFKLEFLQHSGSFKVRGAFANLLKRRAPSVGVVAASGGNHGAAVAFAAMRLGLPAKIFVPSIAAPEKIDRIRGYGADLVVTGNRYDDALMASARWAAESGALVVHAYDQVETLLGQGSVGLEFEEQSPQLDTVLVAVGGGGLIGGVAAWYSNRVRVIGVEPEAAPTLTDALGAGQPIDSLAGGIAADSLAPRRVGNLMFPIAQNCVEQVVLVPDDAIQQAQEALWHVLRVLAEPGGAAAFAAILSRRYIPRPDERVGVLVCGGNVSPSNFARPSPSHSKASQSKADSTSSRAQPTIV